MALIRWLGQVFAADLVRDNGDGTWEAVSRAHTARTDPGTTITVSQSEILDPIPTLMTATSPPSASSAAASLSDLQAQMAKERETLPSPADLIAQHRANLAEQGKLGGQSGARPTQRPQGRPTQQEYRK
jgi:hypothetical protein